MGKQGPCCHCGVASTPLWRNGPPDKPVLCNACGSRWRTKGSLANYTPLHSRTDLDNYEDHRATRIKSISINKSKEKVPKRKPSHDIGFVGGFAPDFNQGPRKVLDEDASNRSSSGSAISNSDSCAQMGGADGSDLTGPAQSVVWDSMVPSRKRTCVGRPKPSPVEKLTKELYTILHEQQSSCFSISSEEDLLFENEAPMVSVEIGHGSVLIRHPSSIIRDEESEASSLSIEKQYSVNEAYSRCLTPPPQRQIKSLVSPSSSVVKSNTPSGEGMQHELLKRDEFENEKVFVLENNHSPLCDINLNDIINVEEFRRHLTNQEQQQLLKYLPPSDTSKLPESIKSLFESPQFKENLSSYQQLLAEGVFDMSFPVVKTEDCKALKRLAISNLSKSQWVGYYHALKNSKNDAGRSLVGMRTNVTASNNLTGAKRVRDSQTQNFSEVRAVKSPQRNIMKAASGNKEHTENESSCFSPSSLFALPLDRRLLALDSLPYVDEISDQDLLLDVPSIGSFAQAELLLPTKSLTPQAGASSSSIHPN